MSSHVQPFLYAQVSVNRQPRVSAKFWIIVTPVLATIGGLAGISFAHFLMYSIILPVWHLLVH